MIRRLTPPLLLLAVMVVGCGGDSPTSPPPTTQPPASTTYTIVATARDANAGGRGIALAVLRVLDGQFAGSVHVTGGNGVVTLTGAQGNMNMEASHTGYSNARSGVGPPATGTTSEINFNLQRTSAWTRARTGNTVLTMPLDLTTVRITGFYNGSSENFILRINGRLVVNEILGTFLGQTTYSGTHQVPAGDLSGTVSTTSSNGVAWTITQVY